MNDVAERVLRKAPVFASLSGSERHALAACTSRKQFQKGELLFAEGDPCTGLSLVATPPADEIVNETRRATAGFTAPKDACTTVRALYQGLQEFEEDLHEHAHLENNILFPSAIGLKGASS